MTAARQYFTTVRIFKSGFLNLFRNGWLTIAATAVMIVALTIIQLAVVLNATANNAIDELGRNLKASIYLVDGTTDQDRKRLEQAITSLDFVDSVSYISVEQAQRDLAEDFNNDTKILQAYALVGTGDVLPASLQVSVNDLKRMSEIESATSQEQYAEIVESVSLGKKEAKKTIERAASAQRFINTGSIIAAVALSAVSIMIIFNTIRMAIYTRREEIQIMKLIGATPNYIRGPFLVEASLYGVIAGIVANSVVYSLIFILGGKVSEQAEFAATYNYFTSPTTTMTMLMGSVLIGILIGVLSSMLAMERHLKLKHW